MKFTFLFHILLLIGMLCLSSACKTRTPKDLSKEALIPYPASLTATGSSFDLTNSTTIFLSDDSEQMQAVGAYLARFLKNATGFSLTIQASSTAPSEGIYLSIADEPGQQQEAYQLQIDEQLVHLSATTPKGLFYGIQTLRQLFPAHIEQQAPQQGPWEIATGTIKDAPEFEYRGAMLDVARHFFTVEDVKRYIDLIAAFKMNMLHLHLSDDQGWRINIKSWPNLATHGGSTEVGGGEGGYYTQEQYAEIVSYADSRFITVIPELDMPGHTNAAIASYPDLECDDREYDLYTGIEVGFSTLCTRDESIYQFVDDVIREMAAITPGPYLHVGGDETLATKEEDYIYFTNRIQEIVKKYGKTLVGWDEVALANLQAGSVVQYWDKAENAQMGVKKQAKVIMSPAKKVYLDMQYVEDYHLGLHWAAYIEAKDAYDWNPLTLVEGIGKEQILGIETPLWSETIEDMEDIEEMAFPRLPGVAEIAWSPESVRDWETYKTRLGRWKNRFEAMGINYYASPQVPWVDE
ncbi:MAG: beta-N-acetylhexosaminidase [Bacteroidota bacterium]